MEEVLAIWNSASEGAKKFIPRLAWDVTKVQYFFRKLFGKTSKKRLSLLIDI